MGRPFAASPDTSHGEGGEKVATMSPKMTLLVKYWEKLVANPFLLGNKTSTDAQNQLRDVEQSCRSVRRRVYEFFTTSDSKRRDALTRTTSADLIGVGRKVEEIVGQFERSASAKETRSCDDSSDRRGTG